jgi:hypothetical protein
MPGTIGLMLDARTRPEYRFQIMPHVETESLYCSFHTLSADFWLLARGFHGSLQL